MLLLHLSNIHTAPRLGTTPRVLDGTEKIGTDLATFEWVDEDPFRLYALAPAAATSRFGSAPNRAGKLVQRGFEAELWDTASERANATSRAMLTHLLT